MSAPHPPAPAPTAEIAALKARVAEKEAALSQSIDDTLETLRAAVDWKQLVADHPLECALGAATLGFLVTYRPEFMGKPAEGSVKMLMNLGAESLVQAAVRQFAGEGGE